jgi:integrase
VEALKRAGIGEWTVDENGKRQFHPGARVHDLRHTAVALAIEAGAHPKAIQELAGHAKITTTLDTYGHLFPTLGDRLAEAMDAGSREAEKRAADFPRTSRVGVVVDLPLEKEETAG